VGIKEVREIQLADAYTNSKGASVAYIDESYVAPAAAIDTVAPFYLVTAYVIPADWQEDIREALPEVVGANYWHSTQAHQSDDGREKIRHFAEYIAEGNEPVIVSMQKEISATDADGEKARSNCFKHLLAALAGGNHCDEIDLAIFEERKYATQRNADARTISEARSEGMIPRTMRVLPTSPSFERLLWLPDLVSFALYRSHSAHQHDYVEPFKERITTLLC
jgi:hypothetical protein